MQCLQSHRCAIHLPAKNGHWVFGQWMTGRMTRLAAAVLRDVRR